MNRGRDKLEKGNPLRDLQINSRGVPFNTPGGPGGPEENLLEPGESKEGTPRGLDPHTTNLSSEGRGPGDPRGDGGPRGVRGSAAAEGQAHRKVIGKRPARARAVTRGKVGGVMRDANSRREQGVCKGLGRNQEPVETSRVRVTRNVVLRDAEKSVSVVGSIT